MDQYLRSDGKIFVFAFVTFILAMMSVIVSFILHLVYKKTVALFYLGNGVLFAAVWLMMNSRIRQFVFPSISVVNDMAFLMIMIMPFPFMIYMNEIQKGRFLANMSHEIRTPISAVLGMNEMILRESKEPNIKEFAMDIQTAGQSLLSIINDILDMSKIESGKMELVLVDYDFSSVVHDVMNMVRAKADEKGLYVKLDVDDSLPARLYGDDVRIRQILTNIMNNAVKYTEKGGVTLSITGETVDGVEHLHFDVTDTGIGIKDADLEKLFSAFERIEESRNRNIEGTGLGMNITMQLLNMMGTQLQVKSVYGEGSSFFFDLEQPIMDFEPIGNLGERIRQQAQHYEYASSFIAPEADVLVVDDKYMNRKVFRNLLKETRIRIDEADSGSACLEKVSQNHYDIIFLDHMMPEMDGVETLHKRCGEKWYWDRAGKGGTDPGLAYGDTGVESGLCQDDFTG